MVSAHIRPVCLRITYFQGTCKPASWLHSAEALKGRDRKGRRRALCMSNHETAEPKGQVGHALDNCQGLKGEPTGMTGKDTAEGRQLKHDCSRGTNASKPKEPCEQGMWMEVSNEYLGPGFSAAPDMMQSEAVISRDTEQQC